jgi:amino acid adenylation domain-containing protein
MDSKYPAARLSFMARDVGVTCVVSDTGSSEQLNEVECPVTSVEELLAALPQAAQPSLSSPQGLAYVIYTSGSTGLPKGVEVTNANLTSFLDATSDMLPVSASERILFSTPLSFDIAGLEIYWPLTTGGTCLVAPSTWLLNTRALVRLINDSAPTLIQATPVGWRLLLEAGASPGADQIVLCGGETLPGPLAQQLAGRAGTSINVYGPTEATIWATSWTITSAQVLIGRAMSHARVYVLDEQLASVCAGDEGQLYLGGPAVARGYRGQLRLTAKTFLPDPWSPEPAGRMYATGDIVRMIDGELEWLRRNDTQVKFNGHRIELGEIEAVALEVEGVQAAVALIGEGPAGQTLRLYVESSREEELVRTHARKRLRARADRRV